MALAVTVTHNKTLIAPDSGAEDKVYGVDYVAADSHIGTVSGFGANVEAFLETPSSVNLKAAVTDETGSGALVFANTPTLVTPILGTPTSGTLTNCAGLPVSSGISGLAANVADFLGTPSSANLAAAVTDETGSGALVFANTPTLVTPVIGAATGTSLALTSFITTAKLTESTTAGAGLTIAAGTATTAVSPLTITQTWNDAGTTFDGIVLDVTNTASGSSSTLFNFKVGGVSQLRYQRNNGALVFATGNISGLTSLSLYNTGYYEWTGRCYIDSGTTANIALHDNAGTSFGLLQFGGTSSSFPAIKRSTTTLQARLADDSAYATFDGKFAASGAAGANFGPGVVTSITVVDGIVTAIS